MEKGFPTGEIPGPKRFFKAIIFDLNGTLVELYRVSEYKKNLEDIVRVLKLDMERFKEAWKKAWLDFPYGDYPSLEARFKVALEHYGDGAERVSRRQIKKASKIRMEYIAGQHRRFRPGALEALAWARDRGYKLGMVSNCSIETSWAWPSNPMAEFIPEPTFSCDVKMKKPEPEIFLNEMNKLHVNDPERVIYVADGDDRGFETAIVLGMTPVLVEYEIHDMYRQQEFPDIDTRIRDFTTFPQVVESLEARKMARR